MPTHGVHDRLAPGVLGVRIVIAAETLEHKLAADVAGHDEDGVLEADDAPLRVRHAAVVENLEEDVEDVPVRLLHLVEEHDGVGPATDSLGELAALLETDVSGRRADQTAHRMLLHVLGHVDAHHRLLRVEQERRQRLGELRLTHAGGTEEHERRDGAVRVGQTRARTLNRLRHRRHRRVLAHDALVQFVRKVEKLLALPLLQLRHGNPGPLRDDVGDVRLGHLVPQQLAARRGGVDGRLRLLELSLEVHETPVLELRRAVQVVVALSLRHLDLHLIDLLLERLNSPDLCLLVLPLRCQRRLTLLETRQLGLQAREPRLHPALVGGPRGRRWTTKRQLFHLQLQDGAVDLVQHRGLGRDLHLELGGRLVDEVDRLVREETVGDVSVGEDGGFHQRVIADADAVMQLVPLAETAEDGDRVFHRGLRHVHLLEPALERGVLLDVLSVLIQRRGADASKLAATEHGLEQVARVHASAASAAASRAHHRVNLVDE